VPTETKGSTGVLISP